MSDLILENPSLLLMMEHFDINIVVGDKRVEQICSENLINPQVFVSIANLYNGFHPAGNENFDKTDTKSIIFFLKNSHRYYLNEKVPEINDDIQKLYTENNSPEIRLVERFFNEYSQEVKEHLGYEDEIAFPYFNSLAGDSNQPVPKRTRYSAGKYLKHHTDIETKVGDLKKLLLKHIPLKNDRFLRRKLLLGLFELESDLNIHSAIEESILIPLIKKIEKQQSVG